MKRIDLKVVELLVGGSQSLDELSEETGKSKSWISQVTTELEEEGFVKKSRESGEVKLSDGYEANILSKLSGKYSLEKLFSGMKEEVLKALVGGPKTVQELTRQGFSGSTVRNLVKDLKEIGVLVEESDGLRINDRGVEEFVRARSRSKYEEEFSSVSGKIIKTRKGGIEGEETAFSAFSRYGISYHPNKDCLYQGEEDIGPEDVLIHAVKLAENRKQMAMAGIFYLKRRDVLDSEKLWKLAKRWDCVERYADLQAFLDRRDVKDEDLFLSYEEFESLARDYDVYLRERHPEGSLLKGLREVGDQLDEEVTVYLLGGANLILRGLKDTTKDIDVVLENEDSFVELKETLEGLGYKERKDVDHVYEKLDTSAILEKKGFPRWDIFVREVAGGLRLTDSMEKRSSKYKGFGKLELRLFSLTDILLFKSITDREGDIEDVALIVKNEEVKWNDALDEMKRQEDIEGKYFSFSVLDTLDVLEERENIEIPVKEKLVSHTLTRALLLTLKDGEKTIKDLREELDFPDYRIYNKLRELEKENKIKVDRSGKLNSYTSK